jgi:hypothetical protein
LFSEFQPDWIIGLGGCSAIDAAKAMWAIYEHPDLTFEKMTEIGGIPPLRNKARFVAIPSTSGTGTEITALAVITDREKGIKYPLVSYELLPDLSIVDGELCKSMPKNVTANTGLDAPLDPTTGYSRGTINSGCVRNRGYELEITATPVLTRDFRWNTTLTWSKNDNKILSLAEGADENQVISTVGTASIIGRVGGTTGDLWGYKLVRDPEGNVIIGDNGLPEQADEIEYVGTAYADWKAGWYNEFSYKGFKLGILLDGQVGGTIYSMSFHKMMEQCTHDIRYDLRIWHRTDQPEAV